jgi:GNAT superfamily N-acetyltransferase
VSASATVDWLPAGRLPELQSFIDSHWEAGHVLARDADLLRWQYRHPEGERLLSVLGARAGRELVGFLGVIQTPFVWNERRPHGAWLAMWLATPEARGSGVGLALVVEAMRRFDVLGAVGLNARTSRIFARLGFDVRPALPRWVAAVDPTALRALGPATVPPVRAGGLSPRPLEWSDTTLRDWDRCWTERVAPGFVGTARDSGFLRWRYVEHPSFDYVVRFAAGDGRDEVSALAVHRVEVVRDRSERVVRIVELLGDPVAAAGLVTAALDDAPDAALADFFCASPVFGSPLERLGFVRAEQLSEPPPDRFQPLAPAQGMNGAFWRREGGGAAFAGAPLYVTRADGDQDRPR